LTRIYPTIMALLLTSLPAFGDTQAIPKGATLSPAQIGHAYGAACYTSQPALMKAKLALWEEAFWFTSADAGDHDFAYDSEDGKLKVVADSGALKAFCELSVAQDAGGDGAELYESLEAHLADRWWRDSPVDSSAIDGGLVWNWTRQDVTHSVTFVEGPDGFTITHVAER